jgi:glutamyl-tRNA synthetase/glutamyl-Q tRNA(Asp) synthetase
VLLRIEDHDRQRCRPEYDAALLEDLAWLGFEADDGPVRQSDPDAAEAYDGALERLRGEGLVYACDCTRGTFAAASWTGPGCPGGCRSRGLAFRDSLTLRVALGGGREAWMDLFAGPVAGEVAEHGDVAIRDRHGNWTYSFAVVVDDARQAVDLVIRGRDLLHATAAQIRLARLLGRDRPPAFLHHPLIHKPSGAKLSKADADTSVRELRAAGASPEELIGRAAAAVGLVPDARPVTLPALVERFATGVQGGGPPPRLAE